MKLTMYRVTTRVGDEPDVTEVVNILGVYRTLTKAVDGKLTLVSVEILHPGSNEAWPVQRFVDMLKLVGQRVDVLLGAEEDGSEHVCSGVLVRLDPEGDFDVQVDDGTMRYCWPALAMRPAPVEEGSDGQEAQGSSTGGR